MPGLGLGLGITGTVRTSGGLVVPIFDDFTRADGPLGANWTIEAGSWAIASNEARATDIDPIFTKNVAIWTPSETPTVTQWVRGIVDFKGNNDFIGFAHRFLDAASPHYLIDFNAGSLYLSYYSDIADNVADNIINGFVDPPFPLPGTGPVVFGLTITGIGDFTEWCIWLNQAIAGAPSSSTLWSGLMPSISTTDNPPAGGANVGRRAGMCFFGDTVGASILEFEAGSF